MFTSQLLAAQSAADQLGYLSDLTSTIGIDLFDEDIDNVVFQTNQFLCNSDFIGSQGPFWWLLSIAELLSFCPLAMCCISTTCSFLSRDTKSTRDKNGAKPRKNKSKNSCARNVLCGISSFRLQRYAFVPEMTRGNPGSPDKVRGKANQNINDMR